jgi:hypothetical protein
VRGLIEKEPLKLFIKDFPEPSAKLGSTEQCGRMKPRFETFWFSGAVTPQ